MGQGMLPSEGRMIMNLAKVIFTVIESIILIWYCEECT
jgi:hypothetical protein